MEFNLGKIAPNWCGTWNSEGDYLRMDCVEYNGSSYMCIQDSYDEIPPSENTSDWVIIAKAAFWAEMTEAEKAEAVRMTLNAITSQGELEILKITTNETYSEDINCRQLYAENIELNQENLIDTIDSINSKDAEQDRRILILEKGGGGGGSLPVEDVEWIDKAEKALYFRESGNAVLKVHEIAAPLNESGDSIIFCDAYAINFDETDLLNLYTITATNEIKTPKLIIEDGGKSETIKINEFGDLYANTLSTKYFTVSDRLLVGGVNIGSSVSTLNNKFIKCSQAQYDLWDSQGKIDENKIYFIIEEETPMMISEPVFSPLDIDNNGVAPMIERFDFPLDEAEPVINESESEETQEEDMPMIEVITDEVEESQEDD